jgi:DNA polymerase III subunit delta'
MYPWLAPTWRDWLDSFTQGRLAHAWLLSGPLGLGKLELARRMAETLLCQHPSSRGPCGLCHSCTLLAHGNHPDLLLLGDHSEKSLGVDLIRDLIGRLNGSAQLGGAKVMIMVRAERMTESAANALLKTLEEPAGRSHLILLSDQPNRLLPTILSRCQKMAIPQPEVTPALVWLRQQEGGSQAQLQHLRLTHYAPLQTLSYLRDGMDARRKSLCERFGGFLQSPEQLEPLLALMLSEAPSTQSWVHILLLDALKLQAGCVEDELMMSDTLTTTRQLAQFSTPHLLAALERWQELAAVPEGMASTQPSLHLMAWLNQLILEGSHLAR